MSDEDRRHWDERYREGGPEPLDETGPPPVFAAHEALLPVSGTVLEIACGRGRAAVWLAGRGLDYFGVDVSPVAIDLARRLVAAAGLESRCRFAVHDLDSGLPEGPPVDLVLAYLFRDPALDQPMIDRLRPGGVLATAVLSEVGGEPGRYRSKPGELERAFAALDVLVHGEGDGMAWLVGRRR